MSYTNPAYKIPRQSVVGMEGCHSKMFDPPTRSPATPDRLDPTNPVPEVMAVAGLQNKPGKLHMVQRHGLIGLKNRTWDGKKELLFFTWGDKDNPATKNGNWPGATIRVPRGVIFHCETEGHGPPPHTVHWHGLEPTPINDGVGHCSMEVGHYTYQLQPNFIGTYFYHCHRNTVQHFEFGLYGMLLVDPPDAYFATQWNPAIPIGNGRPEEGYPLGRRRTAANLTNFPQFPGFRGGLLTDPDPEANNPSLPASLKFQTDPHAMTVPYDVEALWVFDDRDSVWSDLAPDARATYPKHGSIPGVNDLFHENPGKNGFFAFNQFNADYWYVTGVPVPVPRGGTALIPGNLVIPAALNSGVSGTQISIRAHVNQTILLRCLNAAYNCIEVTFPLDVVIIAWDGRAMGVPPYGKYNHAYLIPANKPIHMSVARRCDVLIRSENDIYDVATVKSIDTRGNESVLVTARIPINIGGVGEEYNISGKVTKKTGQPLAGVKIIISGDINTVPTWMDTTATDSAGNYSFKKLFNGTFRVTPSLLNYRFQPSSRDVTVDGGNVSGVDFTT